MPEAKTEPPEEKQAEHRGEDGNGFADAPWYARVFTRVLSREGVATAILALLIMTAGYVAYTYVMEVSVPRMKNELELANRAATEDQRRKDEAAKEDANQKAKEQEMRIALLRQSVDNAKENAENTRQIAQLVAKVLNYETAQAVWQDAWRTEREQQDKLRSEESRALQASVQQQDALHKEMIKVLDKISERVCAEKPKPSGGG